MTDRDPYPDVPRAPYALPEGVPPLQEDPELTRRKLLGIALVGIVSGVALGFGLARWGAAADPNAPGSIDTQREAARRWVRELVSGPVPTLVDNSLGFLLWFELYCDDPAYWIGAALLLREVEANPQIEVRGVQLAERLTSALKARRAQAPISVREACDRVANRKPEHRAPR